MQAFEFHSAKATPYQHIFTRLWYLVWKNQLIFRFFQPSLIIRYTFNKIFLKAGHFPDLVLLISSSTARVHKLCTIEYSSLLLLNCWTELFRAWFILHIVTAGNGKSVTDIDNEFNVIITGDADHLIQTFDIKYIERMETSRKVSAKKSLLESIINVNDILNNVIRMYCSPLYMR